MIQITQAAWAAVRSPRAPGSLEVTAVAKQARPSVPVRERHDPLVYRGGTVVRHHARSWAGVSAALTDVRCTGGLQVDLESDHIRLFAILEEIGGRVTVEARCDASRVGRQCRNPISVIPARIEACAWASPLQHLSHLVLQFDLPGLTELFDEPLDLDATFRPRPAFADGTVLALCKLFAFECAKGRPGGRLFGESLLVSLLLRLSQLDGRAQGALSTGGLAPWQLRRVLDYLDAHFADDLSLNTIAELVGLSTSHFSRAFKQSTDRSPHRWLLDLRCSKAKQLLLQNDLGLAEIACATGFCDQSHFTRTFAQAVGAPPAAWRRARVTSAPVHA